MGSYFTTKPQIIIGLLLLTIGFSLGTLLSVQFMKSVSSEKEVLGAEAEENYWFLLLRKSNVELLFKGIPGDEAKSKIVKAFNVKAGAPGKRPTPLPQAFGRKYWVITKKFETFDNFETAPYFIELDVPAPETEPYGPSPYLECKGAETAGPDGQCNWELPGSFGLHGVSGDPFRLSRDNEGSSGCIRHMDEDITYLYNLIDVNQKIRYYIKDI